MGEGQRPDDRPREERGRDDDRPRVVGDRVGQLKNRRRQGDAVAAAVVGRAGAGGGRTVVAGVAFLAGGRGLGRRGERRHVGRVVVMFVTGVGVVRRGFGGRRQTPGGVRQLAEMVWAVVPPEAAGGPHRQERREDRNGDPHPSAPPAGESSHADIVPRLPAPSPAADADRRMG